MRWKHSTFVALIVLFVVTGWQVPTADAGTVLDPEGNILDIIADPVRNYAYASLSTGELIVIDLNFETISHRIEVSGGADALAISPDGSKLFVALRDSYDVAVYYPGTSSLIDVIDTSMYGSISSMVATNSRLYMNNSWLSITDTTTGTELYLGPEGYINSELNLSPDEQTLFISLLNAYDVSTDEPVQVADACCTAGCFGSNFMSMLFSPTGDEIYLNMGYPKALQVIDWTGGGLLYSKAIIPLGAGQYWNTGMVWGPNNSSLILSFGSYWAGGGERGLIFVRTSDWLPYHVEEAELYVWDSSLVRNPSGTMLVAAGSHYPGSNNRIEIFAIDSILPPPPNRGGIKVRPVDSVEGFPVDDVHLEIPYPANGRTNYFDIDDGIAAEATVEPGTYNVRITSYNYNYDDVYETVDVTVDEWIDLGTVAMTRTGDIPDPPDSCVSQPVTTGEISTVTIHGRNFYSGTTLESVEPGITIQNWSRLDWATIEATIAVEPGLDTRRPLRAFNLDNPDEPYVANGYVFLLPGEERVVSLTAGSASISEGAGSLNLQVTRTGSTTGEISVQYRTVDGTATAGEDYTDTTGTLTWPNGNMTSKTIAVPIAQDIDPEGAETFTVELHDPTGWAILGDHPSTSVTIEDDDASTVRFTAATTVVDEPIGTVSLAVTRTGDTSAAGSVSWSTTDDTAIDGQDYTGGSDALDWPPGDASTKNIVIPILDDFVTEEDETFTVELSSPGGNSFLGEPSIATVAIQSDDVTEISLEFSSATVDENVGFATVTAIRNGVINGAVSAHIATSDGTAVAGSDYTAITGNVIWADGNGDPKTISIPITNDGDIEIDETFVLTLSDPTGGATLAAPSSTSFTIHDDDGSYLRFSAASFAVLETDSIVEISVGRFGSDLAGAVSVDFATGDGTAEAGADYIAISGTLNWVDGDSIPKTFSVTVLDDDFLEGGETLNLTLSNIIGNATAGTPHTATVVIADDDLSEALINTETDQPQTRPDVAMDATGRAVVVWESYLQDGDGWGIFGQRFDATGGSVGAEFQVNDGSSGDQRYPAVAMRPDGGFTVVWTGPDVDGDGIIGRRFNASGTPISGDVVINPTTGGNQSGPDVATDGMGAGLVVWHTDHTGNLDVCGRRLDATGVPTGTELVLNTTTSDDQQRPAVAGSSAGGFVAAWQSLGQDGPAQGIIVRRFATNGSPQGAEFVANDYTSGDQLDPAVGITGDGSFVVVWSDPNHRDGSYSSIQARWFDATATPMGGDIQVNTYGTDNQTFPAVACAGPDNAVIVWQSDGQDGSNWGVFGQPLLANGDPIGNELLFNTQVASAQHDPAVARSASGTFWVVWASSGQDGFGDGVYGLYGETWEVIEIFSDGFESGDTDTWDGSVP